MIVVGRDVTARARAEAERERLLERAAFLAEASASFDEVLDEERTLDALARLSVRDRADTCVILLGGSAAAIRRVATVARDPEDERTLRELVARYPFADRRSHPLLDVLASGRSRLVEHPDGPEMPGAGRAPPRADRALHDQEHRARAAEGARAHPRRDGARLRHRRRRRAAVAVRGPRAPGRAGDRQRAPLRGARQRRAHAPALAAAAGAAAGSGHRARRALRRGRRGQRGRRRLLRLLPDRRRRVGRGDRRRLRQGRRGGGGDGARALHGARVGDAALRPPRGRAPGPQRGDPAARARPAASAPCSTSRSRCTATA